VAELSIVCEELAAQGCPLLAHPGAERICGELITRFATRAAQAWLPRMWQGKIAFASPSRCRFE